MKLNRLKIGDIVIPYSKKCGINNLTADDISGINRDKEFFEPSHQVGDNTANYQEVPPQFFACNLMHVGRDKVLPIALNHTNKTKYVSPAYSIFSIDEDKGVLPEYFFIFLKSDERDRYFWFHTDTSIRDGMTWEDFCDVDIDFPDVDIQRKYVNVYKSLNANCQSYNKGLEDLKDVCTIYIEKLRQENELYRIGDYIQSVNEKNSDGKIKLEQGINIEKEFITPQRTNSNLKGRRIVRKGQFAYCTQLNNENVAIAYRTGEDCVVSSVYDVFEITDKEKLLPEYLLLWLIRPEFGRFVYWASEGSAYEFLNYDNIADYKIPIPSIKIQKSISNIYKVYLMRKKINAKLKKCIKDICPLLIKGSLLDES